MTPMRAGGNGKANLEDAGAIKSVGFQQVACMSEAKYRETMMSSIDP
ncbi:hypothetical protein CBUD_2104 [Coxiella burnetii Dugway 5J108-111]|uniref:Uncharacterized protein n=1 Tax=Coxiella burnetii (strain Dugway 5J108-111) TaxID=434922 RepID=A9KH22_COXBN|nr:hypothetical protein [Coxiella burnetii]ABS77080.2 hypothetical protein CBUD_2104 [Coxiella burnetii Dugway 5J108-111]